MGVVKNDWLGGIGRGRTAGRVPPETHAMNHTDCLKGSNTELEGISRPQSASHGFQLSLLSTLCRGGWESNTYA